MNESENKSFSFSYVHLSPKEQIGLHRQPSWELSCIICGSGTRLIGDRTEPFSSGELILIPPDIPHCWNFDGHDVDKYGKIANITLTFKDDLPDRISAVFPELSDQMSKIKEISSAVMIGRGACEKVVPIMKKMRSLDDADRTACLLEILAILSSSMHESVVGSRRNEDKIQERIESIRSFVLCNATRDISLDDAARHVGMNRSSFCVFCKKNLSMTFFEYLNSYRISLACQMLSSSPMTISEICFQTGFNGVPYFSRVFRKITGMSPKAYRSASLLQK